MACAYSPGNKFIASGGLDNLCSIFNIQESIGWEVKNPYRELQQHEGYLSACRFLDDNQIITSSGDSTIILWDIERQTPTKTFIEHGGDVQTISIHPSDKNQFISGAIDAKVKLWDIRAKECISTFVGHDSDINSVEWFPDGRSFVSGSDDATCRLFDLASHQCINIYQEEESSSTVTSVDFSQSGYYLFAGYEEDPWCLAWNTLTGDKEDQLVHPSRVSCLSISPKGHSIATGCWDRLLRIWA
jgi:guanine nucleotide-binding protein G(I)/G(S)/G(T) subunit beta-1